MKRAAFIDHSFKEKSGSSQFFIDILKENYHVEVHWNDSWKTKTGIDITFLDKKVYDLVVFFQVMNVNPSELRRRNLWNVVFVPMYDASRNINADAWIKLAPYKFINFSKKLHDYLVRIGLNSIYAQYFSSPSPTCDNIRRDKLKGFFWQRNDRVNWNHISSIIKHADFDKIHIHKAIDPPGYEFYPPNDDEKRKYNITMSDWFESRDQYLDLIHASDVFFAPRKFEGIGMSFIEAMAMGKCVVAPDSPTMNEYIVDGRNGLLYDLEKLKPLNFDNINEISKNAYEDVKAGFEKWQQKQSEILKFCEAHTKYWKGHQKMKFHQIALSRIIITINDFRQYINAHHPVIARWLIKIKQGLGRKF
jgi:hypothetical protein